MKEIPVVVSAKHKGKFLIEVEFNDGIKKVIDFKQFFKGPIFEPLNDEAYFKKFYIEGWTIAWPNGADVAPETLYSCEEVSARKAA
jgi:hypothetical protein